MKTKELVLAALFAALTAILSVVRIPLPFTPVPITLQVLAVTISGAILGSKLGFLAQLTYVLLGAVGLPVFSGGAAGLGVIFGPTGGYIIGFIAAAYLIGWLVETKTNLAGNGFKQYLTILLAMAVGLTVIYILGTLQLMLVANLNLKQAVAQGIIPFILPGLIKIAIGAGLTYQVRKRLIAAQLIPKTGSINH